MAGYLGSRPVVVQVDGYQRTEAESRYVNVSGDDFTGHLDFTDDAKARFGSSDEMHIYTESSGSGYSYIQGDNIVIRKADQSTNYLTALGGVVTLCQTTFTGDVTINHGSGATTGVLNIGNANGNGTLAQINMGHSGDPDHGNISYTGSMVFKTGANATALTLDGSQDATFGGKVNVVRADGESDNAYVATFKNEETDNDRSYGVLIHAGSTDVDRALTINDHDGTNPLFYVHGNGRVGIGTTSANNTLDVNGGIVCSPNTDGKDTFELSTNDVNEGRLRIKNVDTTTVQIRAGGDSYFNGGKVGIGITPLAATTGTGTGACLGRAFSGLTVKADDTRTQAISIDSTNAAAPNFMISSLGDGSGSYYMLGANLLLDTAGNVTFENSGENMSGIMLDARGGQGIQFYTGGWNGSAYVPAERMRIDNSGNVGIGALPEAWHSDYRALQIGGGGAIWSHATGGGDASLFIGQNVYHDGAWNYINNNEANNLQLKNGEFYFNQAASGSADGTISFSTAMTLNSDGRLGLGTGNPYAILQTEQDVAGEATALALVNNNVDGSDDSVCISFGLARNNGYLFGYKAIKWIKEQAWTTTASTVDAALTFSTVENETLHERMRIDSAGRTILGQGAPIIWGSSGSLGYILSSNNGDTTISSYDDMYLKSNWIRFWNGSNGHAGTTEYARISATGSWFLDNTTIGKSTTAVATAGCRFDAIGHGYFTSSSGSVLHVHDTSNYKWYVNANGGVYNYSGNNVNLSDEREKKNISSLGSKWDVVKKWSLKEFHYNSDADSDSKKVGVIAQDVEADHPELVTEFNITDTDERKAVKEQQMTWMAIKALQEAMAKIETLEARITTLEGS
jgi:hypothetical protein